MGKRISWFKLLLIILPALRGALEELTHSLAKDSEGGKKITKSEAENIAAAALAAIHGEIGGLLQR